MQPVFQRASKRLIYVYRGMGYGGKQYVFAILVYVYWNIFKTSFSILFIQNALWELPLTNIYSTITPDMLHLGKKGVWEHLINLTLGIIKQISNSRTANQLILELNLHISLVPRYPGLKKFSKGISNLSQITAAEYQQLMRVCFNIGN